MENKFDLDYLKSLYESLDVSDGAKNRFFETFLKEAQAEANPNAKKAGLIHKFLAWLNKGTPTVESSAQAILEALTGIERIIQTSPLLVNDKLRGERDLKYLEKYKTQIERATKDIIDAQAKNKEAQDRFFQSNPKVPKALEQLEQAAKAEKQELEEFQNRIEVAKENPEELQSLKTEAEKIKDEKVKTENDPEAGEVYDEFIKNIDDALEENQTGDTSDSVENPEGEEASTGSGETVKDKVDDKNIGYYGTSKSRGSVFELNDDEDQLHRFESTTSTNTDKKLAE